MLKNLLAGIIHRQFQPHASTNLVETGDFLQTLAQCKFLVAQLRGKLLGAFLGIPGFLLRSDQFAYQPVQQQYLGDYQPSEIQNDDF